MKSRQAINADQAEINITPMLDVVFIMLIFFIVSTSFVKETGMSIFSANNSTTISKKVQLATIMLNLNNDHSVNGISTKLQGIGSILANLKAANPEIQVLILSAADVKTADLVNTIQQIKQNDIKHYKLRSF
jgi:biopolymer transport protein ExbD